MTLPRSFALTALGATFILSFGCATDDAQARSRETMLAEIKAESPRSGYIARRYYKTDYKFWGWVRKPGEPWSSAVLVVFNENKKFAPDRELGTIGSDNNYEYLIQGEFSGDKVYEPASNAFYPEFILKSYELKSVSPGNIYRVPGATDPSRRVIARPY